MTIPKKLGSLGVQPCENGGSIDRHMMPPPPGWRELLYFILFHGNASTLNKLQVYLSVIQFPLL